MFPDRSVAFRRKVKAKRETEADLAIASVWFVFYLLMIASALAPPSFAEAIRLAALN